MKITHHKSQELVRDGKHAWTAIGDAPEGQTWADQMKAIEAKNIGRKPLETEVNRD